MKITKGHRSPTDLANCLRLGRYFNETDLTSSKLSAILDHDNVDEVAGLVNGTHTTDSDGWKEVFAKIEGAIELNEKCGVRSPEEDAARDAEIDAARMHMIETLRTQLKEANAKIAQLQQESEYHRRERNIAILAQGEAERALHDLGNEWEGQGIEQRSRHEEQLKKLREELKAADNQVCVLQDEVNATHLTVTRLEAEANKQSELIVTLRADLSRLAAEHSALLSLKKAEHPESIAAALTQIAKDNESSESALTMFYLSCVRGFITRVAPVLVCGPTGAYWSFLKPKIADDFVALVERGRNSSFLVST